MNPAPPVTSTVEGTMNFYRVRGPEWPWRHALVPQRAMRHGPTYGSAAARSVVWTLQPEVAVGTLERQMLARSATRAAGTLNATRPFARTGAASIPSFASGWIVSELPLHTAALQALVT